MKSDIRHISCMSDSGDIFATAKFEHDISIWSYKNRRLISELKTVLDFGGKRMCLINEKRPVVIAGAYNRYGICAYDAISGEVLWKRKDLKKVQFITSIILPDGTNCIGAGIDSRPFFLLAMDSGETILSLRGIKEVFSDVATSSAIMISNGCIKYTLTNEWKTLWSQKTNTFAVLHCAFGPETILISEAVGALRCFDFKGQSMWEWKPPKESHILRVAWNQYIDKWAARLYFYNSDRPDSLLLFDINGKLFSENSLGRIVKLDFFCGGSLMATSEGQVLDVVSGDILWEFA